MGLTKALFEKVVIFELVPESRSVNNDTYAAAEVEEYYSYNSLGQLIKLEDPVFFKEELSYTSGGYNGAGYYNGLVAGTSITYKPSSFWATPPEAYSVSYAYDEQGRLLRADNTLNAHDLGVVSPMSYDPNGNITFQHQGDVTHTYKYLGGRNQLGNVNGTTVSQFSYDAKGNMTYSGTKGLTLAYDPYFNMASTISNASSSTSYIYGSGEERVLKNSYYNGSNHATLYVRGLEDYPLIEEAPEGTKLYIYGPQGMIAVQQNGNLEYALKDHLGSTRVMVATNGTVLAHYDYLAYGSIMRQTNPAQVNYQYTGQEKDNETDLQNTGHGCMTVIWGASMRLIPKSRHLVRIFIVEMIQ